jgi:RNA polymerase sigma-70 factor, ECF subfamily
MPTDAGKTVYEDLRPLLFSIAYRMVANAQSARVRRESYVGTLLPEPLLTDTESDGAQQVEAADSRSLAFLVLLESLGPVERAVLLLREVFGYGYDEIAGVVGRSEDNCRQIAVRARRQVKARGRALRPHARSVRSSPGGSSMRSRPATRRD